MHAVEGVLSLNQAPVRDAVTTAVLSTSAPAPMPSWIGHAYRRIEDASRALRLRVAMLQGFDPLLLGTDPLAALHVYGQQRSSIRATDFSSIDSVVSDAVYKDVVMQAWGVRA